jgi:hypothetical protein
MTNPYGQPAAPAANDRTQLWGILALVFAILPCCPIIGLIFAILQIVEAKKWNKKPTMGYIAIGFFVFWVLLNIILAATGNLNYNFSTNS